MALHPDFPRSPYAPLVPLQRWFPADETLRTTAYEKLLPPLVAKIREHVYTWRQKGYAGASATSVSLLRSWFETEHLLENADGSLSPFRYYFAQREAVETLIWLYDVRRARDKFDLLRFDASGAVSSGMFDEDWPRYVLKMATGAGKTKVLSLLIAWSFFHRLYRAEPLPDSGFFHGKTGARLVVVGPINLPVGRLFVEEVITECRKRGATRVDVLAFEFEMGLFPAALDEAKQKGIDLTPKTIPPEVFDKRAVERGQVRFQDVAYIEVTPRFDSKHPLIVAVELTDFSVFYSQGLADAIAPEMKEGKSEVICDAGKLIKVSKDKQGVITQDVLTKHWTDWVDSGRWTSTTRAARKSSRCRKAPASPRCRATCPAKSQHSASWSCPPPSSKIAGPVPTSSRTSGRASERARSATSK